MGYGDVRGLDCPSRLILAIPVFLYIRRVNLNINIIWIASAIGVITSGIYAGYQYEILEMGRGNRNDFSYLVWPGILDIYTIFIDWIFFK